MKWVNFLTTLLCWLVVSCTDINSQEVGLKLPAYNYMTFNNSRLPVEQVDKLKQFLANLPKTQHKFYEKPEIILTGFKDVDSEPDFYSIFLKEGYIYQDYFLEAWNDRMQDKTSPCYKLDEKTRRFLINLEKSL
ncbi:MAG: hypothetical protein SVR94_17625 [Pseudomonadota bacterium]|nr:hypothetical protein [Pseudomonadota bacterium]